MTAEIPFSNSFSGDSEFASRHSEEDLRGRALRQAELNREILESIKRDGDLILPEPPVSLRPRKKRSRGQSAIPKTGPLRIPMDS